MIKPLCFVLMPFGKKTDHSGRIVDFDKIYKQLILPSIESAGMEPLRADEEMVGGIIHKPMFERLVLCEYAIADLTSANANVFYELGIRHAARPWATIPIYAKGLQQIPFDVSPVRAIPYEIDGDCDILNLDSAIELISCRLNEAKGIGIDPAIDSPLFQLLEGFPDVQHTKTDVFRDRVTYAKSVKQKIAIARHSGLQSIVEIENSFPSLHDVEAGIVIDLFLSYRSVEAWKEMVELTTKMSQPIARTVLVQEQLALALNRLGRSAEAERTLLELIEDKGPSSETYGILGRVYKDRWKRAIQESKEALARGLLDQAIDAYRRGFETDWRDTYPGINLATLLDIRDGRTNELERLLCVVSYSLDRKLSSKSPDYWDYATKLEIAILERDRASADAALSKSLAAIREKWEAKSTASNLELIRNTWEARGEEANWVRSIEDALITHGIN